VGKKQIMSSSARRVGLMTSFDDMNSYYLSFLDFFSFSLFRSRKVAILCHSGEGVHEAAVQAAWAVLYTYDVAIQLETLLFSTWNEYATQ
jgi:hypothetical protein